MANPTQGKTLNCNHAYWVNNHSFSANWYKRATNLQPSPVNKYTSRKLAVIIARLRLGYKCNWEVIAPQNRECTICERPTTTPLLHYLLECHQTASFRDGTEIPEDADHPDALRHSILIIQKVLNNLDTFKNTLLSFPPPR